MTPITCRTHRGYGEGAEEEECDGHEVVAARATYPERSARGALIADMETPLPSTRMRVLLPGEPRSRNRFPFTYAWRMSQREPDPPEPIPEASPAEAPVGADDRAPASTPTRAGASSTSTAGT